MGDWITATATGVEGTSEFFPAEPITPRASRSIDAQQDSVNLKQQGRIAVAILSTPDFNAPSVNAMTVGFAGAAAVHRAIEDVNHDGLPDMVLHFHVQDTPLRDLYNSSSSRTRTRTACSIDPPVGQGHSDWRDDRPRGHSGLRQLSLFLAGNSFRQLLQARFGS